MKNYLGIDLGGTKTAAAVVTETGEIVARVSRRTERQRHEDEIIADIALAGREAVAAALEAGMRPEDAPKLAGVGSPGAVDAQSGVVTYSCNLGFSGTPLAEKLSGLLGMPVFLENDANAAALGEYLAGAGRGTESMVMLTFGTGVGAGVVLGGRLLSGCNGAGAELGHMVIESGGRPCSCGRRGCWEAYSSATALKAMSREAAEKYPDSALAKQEKIGGATAFLLAKEGDEASIGVIGEFFRYLACGIVNTINIFQPDCICIGGGLSNEGPVLIEGIREAVEREDYARDAKKRCRLTLAELGNSAGLIGAALLCTQGR